MKIVFVEVQQWEKEYLRKEFPDALLIEETIEEAGISQIANAEIISCFIYSQFTSDVLSKLPQLKYITTRATGFDNIDTNFSKEHGISVSNVPEYGSSTVAEHTFALLLSLTRKIYQSVNQAKTLQFEHENLMGVDLDGKTIGIVGFGKIGQHVAQIANGFGMKVLAYNRSQDPELAKKYNATYVSLPDILSQSDVISLHLPLNDSTRHTINGANITSIKRGAFLINTARGGLIDTEAVAVALDQGILSGVGLDVLENELDLGEEVQILSKKFKDTSDYKTLVLEHVLMNHPKVLITPHNAFNSKEALMRILQTTIENIKGYIAGTVKNTV